MSGCRRLRAALAGALVLWTLSLASAPAAQSAGEGPGPGRELPEYLVKAGFLFNFAKYVAWPSDAFASPAEPIAIGIIGEDPFGLLLEQTLAGKQLGGRSFRVERFANPAQIAGVHILFVPRSERARIAPILERVRQQPVLTVGEDAEFTTGGGVISILIEAQHPSLQINRAAAQRQQLEIASNLLRVAVLVEGGR